MTYLNMNYPNRRTLFVLVFALLAICSGAGAPPANAQVIKPYGIPIPAFFFSGSERRAREACAAELPECRVTVRAELEQEMAVSLMLPWLGLGLAVLGALFWLRAQDKKKERARAAARRHHEPGAFRKLDQEPKARTKDTDTDDDDMR